MEEAVGAELRRIVLRYGPEIAEDARRVEALLRDLSGEYRREIFVLAGAAREGVPAELMSSQGTVPAAVTAERLARTLQDNLGLGEDSARWAVATWASALAAPDPTSVSSAPPISVPPVSVPPVSVPPVSVPPVSVPPSSLPSWSEADVADRLMALPLDDTGDAAWSVLGLLTAADGPLTMGDAAGILSLPVRQVHRAIQPIADLILRDGRLQANDEPVRQAVTGYLGADEVATRREALAHWCTEQVASIQPGRDVPDYVLRHASAHLAAQGDVEALSRLVDPEWMRLSFARTGSPSAFTRDMLRAAQAAAAQSPPDRSRELRASLAGVTAASNAAEVPPEALGVLARAGQPERAMALATTVEPPARGNAYYRIAEVLHATGADEAADAAAARAIAAAVLDMRESGSVYALQALADSIHKSGMTQWAVRAVAVLQTEAPPDRHRDFLAVEVRASAGDVDGAWQAARHIDEPNLRDLALRKVVAHLAQAGRIREAAEAAQDSRDNRWGLTADICAITAERGDMAATMATIGSVPEDRKQWAVIEAGTALAKARRVDEISALMQTLENEDDRATAARRVASVLAETGQADHAVSVWKAVTSPESTDYFTADLAKIAANAGDVDGALQIASGADNDYVRRNALSHVASAVARTGDLPRATSVVRVIGSQSGEDDAFAAVAKDLAAHSRFDDAVAMTSMITRPPAKAASQLVVAESLASAGHYPRSAALAGETVEATTNPQGGADARALLLWARVLALSGRPGQAIAAAERAISVARVASEQRFLAEALAAGSGAFATAGREDEAADAARQAIAVLEAQGTSEPSYAYKPQVARVTAILAEAGPPGQAIVAAQCLAEGWERDEVLSQAATSLARRGLGDQAIDALRARSYGGSYQFKDTLSEVVRILAKQGNWEGALQAAHAAADPDDPGGLAEHDQADLVREAARTLAENGAIEAALSLVRASTPAWNRSGAFTEVACAVALAGDISRAAEIAGAVGSAALAKVAGSLADLGRIGDALPLAENAIRRALATPLLPTTADALAALECFATLSPPDEQGEQDLLEAARAGADPANRAGTDLDTALTLALDPDPDRKSEAVTMAEQARQDARGNPDPGERAMVLATVARVFALAGEPATAADTAAEGLAAAASAGFSGDAFAVSAILVLVEIGRLTEALAGIGSLFLGMTKARALGGMAGQLAQRGQPEKLLQLVDDTDLGDMITEAWARIPALAAIGLALTQVGEAGVAGRLAQEAADLTGELTQDYEKAVAHAEQAELLAALERGPEAVQQANQALAVARKPIGGWRGYVITKAVKALVSCGHVDEAVTAVKSAPADSAAECVAAAAAALFGAGDRERATALVSDALAAIRAAGSRSAFYDLTCTHLPRHPDLFAAWLGADADMPQIGRELAAIEHWWPEQ